MPDLKELLGEHFSEELAKAISTAYGKETVSKEDFNKRGTTIKGHEETIRKLTEELDHLKTSSPDIADLQQQLAEANAKLEKADLQNTAWKQALQAGAKNPDTILLLSAKFLENAKLSDDKGKKSVEGYANFLKGLAEAEDTASLFTKPDGKPTVQVSGAHPANPGNKAGGADDSASYQTRLAEARKTGNTAEAVAIKNEAAAEGIYLL